MKIKVVVLLILIIILLILSFFNYIVFQFSNFRINITFNIFICVYQFDTKISAVKKALAQTVEHVEAEMTCEQVQKELLAENITPMKIEKEEEITTVRGPSSVKPKKKPKLQYGPSIDHCPKAPKKSDSIFERVSGAYCRHAFDRLFKN